MMATLLTLLILTGVEAWVASGVSIMEVTHEFLEIELVLDKMGLDRVWRKDRNYLADQNAPGSSHRDDGGRPDAAAMRKVSKEAWTTSEERENPQYGRRCHGAIHCQDKPTRFWAHQWLPEFLALCPRHAVEKTSGRAWSRGEFRPAPSLGSNWIEMTLEELEISDIHDA